jgi:hypothetical protein
MNNNLVLSYNNRIKVLCRKLLEELRYRIEDHADSNLPEWEKEAERLGITK